MISDSQRLKLHRKIEECQSLRELKDLARALIEREIKREEEIKRIFDQFD